MRPEAFYGPDQDFLCRVCSQPGLCPNRHRQQQICRRPSQEIFRQLKGEKVTQVSLCILFVTSYQTDYKLLTL